MPNPIHLYSLIAIGDENPIVFTSSSNNPGNYDWSGIDFQEKQGCL